MRVHKRVSSPLGELTLVSQGGELAGLYLAGQRYFPDAVSLGVSVDSGFEEVERQLAEYFAGRRRRFEVPVRFAGTVFQNRVWRALCEIPAGETVTYGALARRLGVPSAARAVGAANGRNPVSIVVPCHRVVGASGALTGYAGGVARKRALLDLEAGGVLWWGSVGAVSGAASFEGDDVAPGAVEAAEVVAGAEGAEAGAGV
ncbi:methylated-DNA-[protein]-cysteine S-methyltransferase [Stackebrandtia albiflava]|uniref:Methylated-DNA--protein-cysteine methyltransferase n=1 Tax=Stackebrandtia albiflava TaxID=406432 RepID=A0A562VDE5_9ACTN|nr:methylated-DNA--[protein]-cysteine S-methyltransferase [Stackebrandtia albiflava]TWJ15878.1 methylated-DNA-[protein]-cysteine S-methyltransferase [Stackebrandtia albiflava]